MRFEFEQVRFAAPVRLTFYAPSEEVANQVSGRVFERLKQLDRILSDYDPDSELSKLIATAGSGEFVPVGDDLWNVLVESQRLSEKTGGAFDITIAPVVKLWRTARLRKTIPTETEQAAAMARVGYRSLELDEQRHAVRLAKKGMLLDVGGIAQGYAADEAFKLLLAGGVTRALVDVSGDIRVGDPPPGKSGWRIEIEALKSKAANGATAQPRFVTVANAAISTSGDAYQFYEVNGVRYSHILDARTGRPMTQSCSVTVIAKDCLTADALDTAVCVLDDEAGRKLVSEAGAEMLRVRVVDGKAALFESDGIRQYESR